MNLLFALYKYFPFGGLQRDMLAIAFCCAEAGHHVTICCQHWEGKKPQHSNLKIESLGWGSKNQSNHKKNQLFAEQLKQQAQKIKPDLIIGFNKIPGIDIYYAADTCFKAKLYEERPRLFRLLPRYRSFVKAEESLFTAEAKTHILAIAQGAINEYQKYYKTPDERFTLLPPGIDRGRINKNGERSHQLHKELKIPKENKIILMVGSGFRTKGVDRSIEALASLPENLKTAVHLVIAGDDNKKSFLEQAKNAGIDDRVHFVGGRNDVPELLKSAELLIHPARRENTGTILLEAAVACLPVLTTSVCGYSHYISENNVGAVLPEPFNQKALNKKLQILLTEDSRNYREAALAFAQTADIYDMPTRALEVVVAMGREKGHS